MDNRETLESWQEIADHFEVTKRTVQKWEKERSLPVRRRNGQARVYAYVEELEEWKEGAAQRRRLAPVVIGAVLVVLASVTWLVWPQANPASWKLDGDTLLVFDADGGLLWSRELERLDHQYYEEASDVLVADIDDDGLNEVLFNVLPQEVRRTRSGYLLCLDNDGTLLWRHDYGKVKTFAGEEHSPYYEGRIVRIVNSQGKKHIFLAVCHKRSPSQVLFLDPTTGSKIDEYWHPGHINAAVVEDLDNDGNEEIILGGPNNLGDGIGHAALFVLNVPRKPANAEAPSHYPVAFTGGGESRYFLFPTAAVAYEKRIVPSVRLITSQNTQFTVRISYFPHGHIDYTLTKDFQVIGIHPSDSYAQAIQKLKYQGELPLQDERLDYILEFPTAPNANSLETLQAFTKAKVPKQ